MAIGSIAATSSTIHGSRFTIPPSFPFQLCRVSAYSSFVEQAIESFIRFLAVERGLSENYQLSTQRSLTEFARWCASKKKIDRPRAITLPLISEYLAHRKRSGLSA